MVSEILPAKLAVTQFYPNLMFYSGGVRGRGWLLVMLLTKQKTFLAIETGSVIIYWICFHIRHILSVILLNC